VIRKAITGVWSTSKKVAEKEIQIRLEVPKLAPQALNARIWMYSSWRIS
jgi:hypothetical protein